MLLDLKICWNVYLSSIVGGLIDSSRLRKRDRSAIFLFGGGKVYVAGANGVSLKSSFCLLSFCDWLGLMLVGFFFYLAMPPILFKWI